MLTKMKSKKNQSFDEDVELYKSILELTDGM